MLLQARAFFLQIAFFLATTHAELFRLKIGIKSHESFVVQIHLTFLHRFNRLTDGNLHMQFLDDVKMKYLAKFD
jgi:hypothetical protein